ncbi:MULTISPECIES: MarR family winged helix-turn-helix transcriptional regulator [Arthrobacter]|uniref:MarR family transcriptional regulator n=1 Tax=Arthrobacter terricola TaxID=2547396 RepID=A0A4R5KSR0_9MICC|nr:MULTISPECIES: MarR family transcriptional regulator [Arthrobacter]MBT8160752.1 MarR family transcriptional regulator [Arthrobacter sp. GN70]TDF97900.1 MarR family transcriptional regulator [Arthrobacter terricola]
MEPASPGRPSRAAFLLSQLGAVASSRFAVRTREIGLSPSDAGVIRLLGREPGLSQRSLADRLGAVPSRVVSLIDSLQERGLVERTRSNADRRNYELHLTDAGTAVLRELREIAEKHEAELLAPLNREQIAQLGFLLAQLAAGHGLDADLHRDVAREPVVRESRVGSRPA